MPGQVPAVGQVEIETPPDQKARRKVADRIRYHLRPPSFLTREQVTRACRAAGVRRVDESELDQVFRVGIRELFKANPQEAEETVARYGDAKRILERSQKDKDFRRQHQDSLPALRDYRTMMDGVIWRAYQPYRDRANDAEEFVEVYQRELTRHVVVHVDNIDLGTVSPAGLTDDQLDLLKPNHKGWLYGRVLALATPKAATEKN